MSRLLDANPCPWCKGHVSVVHASLAFEGPFVYRAQCGTTKCWATGPGREHPRDAVAAWVEMCTAMRAVATSTPPERA